MELEEEGGGKEVEKIHSWFFWSVSRHQSAFCKKDIRQDDLVTRSCFLRIFFILSAVCLPLSECGVHCHLSATSPHFATVFVLCLCVLHFLICHLCWLSLLSLSNFWPLSHSPAHTHIVARVLKDIDLKADPIFGVHCTAGFQINLVYPKFDCLVTGVLSAEKLF